MKIISLGGGGADVVRIKLTKGYLKGAFETAIPEGSDIWQKLHAASPLFTWEDEDGAFGWSSSTSGDFAWQEF